MAQKKFKPKAGNPAKAAAEMQAFKERAEREERDRAKARQERKEALAEGLEQVAVNGAYRSAPREKPPTPFTFNIKADGSSAGVSYTPRTTITPVSKVQSDFTPRTDLDDVVAPETVVRTTKSGKTKPVMPKAGMTKRKAGQIVIAGLGLSAMVGTGILIPALGGTLAFPGSEQVAEQSAEEQGPTVLVDRNGMPLDADPEDADFQAVDPESGETVDVEVSPSAAPSTDPSALPSAAPEDVQPAD